MFYGDVPRVRSVWRVLVFRQAACSHAQGSKAQSMEQCAVKGGPPITNLRPA